MQRPIKCSSFAPRTAQLLWPATTDERVSHLYSIGGTRQSLRHGTPLAANEHASEMCYRKATGAKEATPLALVCPPVRSVSSASHVHAVRRDDWPSNQNRRCIVAPASN